MAFWGLQNAFRGPEDTACGLPDLQEGSRGWVAVAHGCCLVGDATPTGPTGLSSGGISFPPGQMQECYSVSAVGFQYKYVLDLFGGIYIIAI